MYTFHIIINMKMYLIKTHNIRLNKWSLAVNRKTHTFEQLVSNRRGLPGLTVRYEQKRKHKIKKSQSIKQEYYIYKFTHIFYINIYIYIE